MDRRKMIGAGVFIAGLVVAAYASRSVAWHIQGFDKSQAVGSPDCDDCVTTATLDALPYIAAGLAIYLLVAVLVWWLVFHSDRRAHNTSNAETHAPTP